MIDLRSDTVTHPTPAMREAMARAEVGDDVYREDPTVNHLEAMAAELLGKESALFVPSGTMGNLIGVLGHCQRGDEVIMGHLGHTFLFEGGGVSALGGVFVHTLPNQPDGTLRLDDILAAIRPPDVHHPITRLVVLENTHNRCGGVPLSVAYTRQVGDAIHARGLALHLDGARIFNAAVALGVTAKALAEPADTVTFCLSKGLCAPVGSVLCGSREFIERARRIRKQLGGGMRQAGILAAAGIVALETMIDRLAEDHRRARMLAEGLVRLPGISLPMGMPATNMVFISLDESLPIDAPAFAARLANYGVRVGVVGVRQFRLVTHYWIGDAEVAQTLEAFRAVLSALG
ncbi:low-specificity L-threonine aldolase [Thermanaerothrix sp. 4228-RoL]|uniref:Low-specificity L-threonine aldolase n=1 Tax=Thermanaerothrix solaris TaxID=3058434 RepID=A0ABU3NQH7_9CHLR|nr:low-specificity L-threonine aldolase [Thermanaerothrix sp. 4228-RoL]MDT8899100.1 low-specificity L-threonine aldolase [Thermanaerothrix sp. 4228-RoL]